jgi:ribonucleoside-diphosphate reductase alpha subunit
MTMTTTDVECEMRVIKRNGTEEPIAFDKILQRIKKMAFAFEPHLVNIPFAKLAIRVIEQLYDRIPTSKIDEFTAQQCASMITQHLEYGDLASRIVISNHHKNTNSSFYETMKQLWEFRDNHNELSPLVSEHFWRVVERHHDEIEQMFDYQRDYLFDYFGFKTLERSYLMRVNNHIIERPQHLFMRVAIGIHGDDLNSVRETYEYMSKQYFIHATPTLFNAGTPRPQLSSCYLLSMENDSIQGIYNTLQECASISKWAGGIGLHIHNIRGTGTHIRGTNGTSNGIVPMLRVFNMTARYVDQGGGKRNGSFAIYLEPWHSDIYAFLDLKKNHGDEEMRARDLFYALWIPSLFMEKVKNDEMWHLFCPDACHGLSDVYGDEFNALYNKFVSEKKYTKEVKARELWFKVLDSQMETGTPYLLYKDACNEKSNQKNLGTIKSSNLCTEIIEYSDSRQTAVCNLASIGLPKFVDIHTKTFNYKLLFEMSKIVTRNLNRIIDINFYPTPKTEVSNLLHRPIGIGVQGLADVFMLMDIPFNSQEARELNVAIFETIYQGSLVASCELARERADGIKVLTEYHIRKRLFEFNEYEYRKYRQNEPSNKKLTLEEMRYERIMNVKREYAVDENTPEHILELLERYKPIYAEVAQCMKELEKGTSIPIRYGSYSSFEGSPVSNGILQFDMWKNDPSLLKSSIPIEDRTGISWEQVKEQIHMYGVRNSLLVAPMPTASTSQILGNNECFEPYTSNIYTRRTLAGEFIVINHHLMKELSDMGLWNTQLKDSIIANKGSIQHIEGLTQHMKDKYRIVWEIPMKQLIDMSADRGQFICQSQSMNLWMEEPTYKTLTAMHFYAWKKGLKTGLYYLRRKPRHTPQQFTIEPPKQIGSGSGSGSSSNSTSQKEEHCEMCSA